MTSSIPSFATQLRGFLNEKADFSDERNASTNANTKEKYLFHTLPSYLEHCATLADGLSPEDRTVYNIVPATLREQAQSLRKFGKAAAKLSQGETADDDMILFEKGEYLLESCCHTLERLNLTLPIVEGEPNCFPHLHPMHEACSRFDFLFGTRLAARYIQFALTPLHAPGLKEASGNVKFLLDQMADDIAGISEICMENQIEVMPLHELEALSQDWERFSEDMDLALEHEEGHPFDYVVAADFGALLNQYADTLKSLEANARKWGIDSPIIDLPGVLNAIKQLHTRHEVCFGEYKELFAHNATTMGPPSAAAVKRLANAYLEDRFMPVGEQEAQSFGHFLRARIPAHLQMMKHVVQRLSEAEDALPDHLPTLEEIALCSRGLDTLIRTLNHMEANGAMDDNARNVWKEGRNILNSYTSLADAMENSLAGRRQEKSIAPLITMLEEVAPPQTARNSFVDLTVKFFSSTPLSLLPPPPPAKRIRAAAAQEELLTTPPQGVLLN